jgi:hypothetical protein
MFKLKRLVLVFIFYAARQRRGPEEHCFALSRTSGW